MMREFSLLEDYSALIQLIKTLRAIQPDVVHLHSSKRAFSGRIACLLLSKKKVFYTPHGYAFLRTDITPIKKKTYRAIEFYFKKYPEILLLRVAILNLNSKKIGPSLLVNGITINEVQKYSITHNNSTLTIEL
jgi:hypothetical protein